MTRGIGRFLAIALTGLGIATGFATGSTAQTITFRFNDAEEREMRAALDRFEQANPGVRVQLQRTSWRDARDQFLREAAVGQGPDVVHIAFVWTRELAQAGVVLPLDPLLARTPIPGGIDGFVASDLVKHDGKVYGVPWTADTWALVYRRDLLDQAGIGDLPATWAQLREASAQVKARTGKTGFGFPAGSSSSGAMWFLANYYWWSNGKEVVSRTPGGFAITIGETDIAAAMAYFHAFLKEGHAPTSLLAVSDAHDPAILQALRDGNQAIAAMPTNTYKLLVEEWRSQNPGRPVPFVSGLMPAGTGPSMTHLGGRTLVVNANTRNADVAMRLVRFLNTPEIFAEHYRSQFPAQRALLQQVRFEPWEAGYARQLADHARSWGAYAEGPAPIGRLWNLTTRSFGAALSGQQTHEVAAADLLRGFRRTFEGN